MVIPRKRCKKSKSLSPVIMQEAFDATANSRNLLSLVSRQSVIFSETVNSIRISLKSFISFNLFSKETYLSNLERTKTSESSSNVSILLEIFPNFFALLYASVGVEYSNRKALRRLLVSITKCLFFIQQVLKNFFCEAIFSGFRSDVIKQTLEIRFFQFFRNSIDLFPETLFQLLFNSWRNFSPLFCCRIIHFNYDSFHSNSFYCFSNLQNLNFRETKWVQGGKRKKIKIQLISSFTEIES